MGVCADVLRNTSGTGAGGRTDPRGRKLKYYSCVWFCISSQESSQKPHDHTGSHSSAANTPAIYHLRSRQRNDDEGEDCQEKAIRLVSSVVRYTTQDKPAEGGCWGRMNLCGETQQRECKKCMVGHTRKPTPLCSLEEAPESEKCNSCTKKNRQVVLFFFAVSRVNHKKKLNLFFAVNAYNFFCSKSCKL